MRLFCWYLHYIYDLSLCICYVLCIILCIIFYAVVRQISMLFIDNKIYVFYICPLADQPKSLHHCPCQQTFRYFFVWTSPSIDKTHAGASRNTALLTTHDQNRLKIWGHNLKLVLVRSLRAKGKVSCWWRGIKPVLCGISHPWSEESWVPSITKPHKPSWVRARVSRTDLKQAFPSSAWQLGLLDTAHGGQPLHGHMMCHGVLPAPAWERCWHCLLEQPLLFCAMLHADYAAWGNDQAAHI